MALVDGLRLIAVASLLVTVTLLENVWPTATLPIAKLAGLKPSGITPVPVSVTSCGLVEAPSVKVMAPVTAPAIVGLNVTFTVQLLPAARELPQLFDWAKSPLAVMEPILSGPEPEFERVIAFEAVIVPAATLPKLKLEGLTLAVAPEASST